jgi:hypothetical protein
MLFFLSRKCKERHLLLFPCPAGDVSSHILEKILYVCSQFILQIYNICDYMLSDRD